MSTIRPGNFGILLLALWGCGGREPSDSDSDPTGTEGEPGRLTLASVDPLIVDPIGGSRLTIRGEGFEATAFQGQVDEVTVGGALVTAIVVVSDTELEVLTGPVEAGVGLEVVVGRGEVEAALGGIEAWSPAELSGARVFDAASGVEVEEEATAYEWQRLTAEIHPDWRVRDGNTLNWLPATGKFWMVAGWNGYQEPEGFSVDDPALTYPPQNTTTEVWSSPDGVDWTLELPHGNTAFERRHSQNTVLWNNKLWMIGGDTHQGFYNHDVVSSPDGVNWTVELGPGAQAEPPWAERALQFSGVYDGKLWTAGGQDLLGPQDVWTYHNDVWSTEDGVNWTEVVADGPPSETRWAGCGAVDGLVEFKGRMWLVGCARYRDDGVPHTLMKEVWSTTDGAVWKKHTTPPWAGKIWHNVVVWDNKLWILFGYTEGDSAGGWPAGNANEVWFSEDGETWEALPHGSPQPGSHAQGVAVTDEFLLYAGGNYSFGYPGHPDKSAWRLVPFRGQSAKGWTDRGDGALVVEAPDEGARPVWVPEAFGAGSPGLQFDGSTSVLWLEGTDEQASGRSVFWVARSPVQPAPWAWEEVYAPLGTVVGGSFATGMPRSSVGYSDGRVSLVNLAPDLGPSGETLYETVRGGEGLQEGPGEVRFAGLTHDPSGTVQIYVDGVATGEPGAADYSSARGWSRIGGGFDDAYYGPNSRFGGTLGAVVVLPEAASAETAAKIHAWARGRFGAR